MPDGIELTPREVAQLEAEVERLRSWRASVVQEAMAQGWAEGYMAHVDPTTSGPDANPYLEQH